MTYTVGDRRKHTDHAYFTITIKQDAPDGLTSRYRGRGDQVFVLNPEGEELDGSAVYAGPGRRNGGGVRDRDQHRRPRGGSLPSRETTSGMAQPRDQSAAEQDGQSGAAET